MDVMKTIQVQLPAYAELTPDDLELLDAACHAIVARRCQESASWVPVEHALSVDGWTVTSRVMWVAEARRGREVEQGIGATKDEAFEQLQQFTRLDELTGVP